ncbi:MAG: acyltransferase [Verrucomicrobiae bacterium]|nr:acyltransferase [Verrucomicrobiae bacterium]MCP5540186.1 acyltransferase [Akkermansiaceae bacterium]MCP5551121.1 acyltransferase [Akkermansiaceae bacterium]
MNRVFGLDAARTLAIAMVVLSHAHQRSHDIGVFGVELFFALSGFLIGAILFRNLPDREPWTLSAVANFWSRRWWRTLPNYFLFLVVSIGFHQLFGSLPPFGEIAPYFAFCQNLTDSGGDFFGVSWSLCVEEWFYLLFPLALLAVHRLTRSRLLTFAIVGVVFLGVSPAIRQWVFTRETAADAARFVTLARMDAIAYGVAAAVFVQMARPSPRLRIGLALAGSGLLALVLFRHALPDSARQTAFTQLLLTATPAAFALMMPLLGSWEKLPAALESFRLPVTRISQWSYSIYLAHYPILMTTYAAFGDTRELPGVNLLSKLTGLSIAIFVARSVYRNFEVRLTSLRPSESGPGHGPEKAAPTLAAATPPSPSLP